MTITLKNKHTLQIDDFILNCSIGKKGLSSNKKEGDLRTPRGIFKFTFLMYREDKIKKISSKLKKIKIKKNMGWCDDPASKYYNKMIKFPFKESAEKLYLSKNIYDLILAINFNTNPVVKGKGSAIFLHIAEKKFKPTKGCLAIKRSDFIKILPFITKKTSLIIY